MFWVMLDKSIWSPRPKCLSQDFRLYPVYYPSAIFSWCSRIRTPDIRISSLLGYHCAEAADFFFIFRCLFFTFCNVQSLILSSVARWLEKGQILKKVAKTVAKRKMPKISTTELNSKVQTSTSNHFWNQRKHITNHVLKQRFLS